MNPEQNTPAQTETPPPVSSPTTTEQIAPVVTTPVEQAPETPEIKPSLWKRILKTVAYTVLFIILLNISLFWLYPFIMSRITSDLPSVNDQDLALSVISVPDNENAYFDFLNTPAEFVGNVDKVFRHLDEDEWDQEFVTEVLLNNKELLLAFASSSQKEKFQDPQYINIADLALGDQPIPTVLTKIRRASWLVSLHSITMAKSGSTGEAFSDAFATLSVSKKIQNAQGDVQSMLVGVAVKKVGLAAVREAIAMSTSTDELLLFSSQLDSFKNTNENVFRNILVEYTLEKNFFKKMGGVELLSDILASNEIDTTWWQKLVLEDAQKKWTFWPLL